MAHLNFRLAIGAVLVLGLSGCDTFKEQVGLTKKSPDEFTVITKAPLVMPPDFSLRPPRPGEKRPQEVAPTDQARAVLLSQSSGERATADRAQQSGRNVLAGAAGETPGGRPEGGELELLQKAGAENADSSIRQTINRETSVLAEKDSSFADRLIFWQPKKVYGSTVDAGKEVKRLREADADGETDSATPTPVIERRKRGWLEDIF